MTPHNNIGYNSKSSEDMAAEITKNHRFWPPHCCLRPLAMGPLRISAWTLHRLKVDSLCYVFTAIFCLFFQISVVSSRTHHLCSGCGMAVQGHPRSLILVSIESAHMTSY